MSTKENRQQMQRIEGIEAIFGDCAFDVSTRVVVEEDYYGSEDCSCNTAVHHKGDREENQHYGQRWK